MSHTNSTQYYNLPQFVTTDKPAWLTDVNNAYAAIDAGIHTAKSNADSAQSDATQALSDAGSALTTANTANTKAGSAVASISEEFLDSATYDVGDLVIYNNLLYICHTAVEVPGAWTGNTNWSRTTVDTLVTNLGNDIPDSIGDLSDVTLTTPQDGQVLTVADNGASIVNASLPTVDSSLSDSSTNAVQNQAVTAGIAAAGNGLKFAHITTTTDGRYYTAKFGGFVTSYERIPVLVIHAQQTGSVAAAETVVLLKNGNIIKQSGSNITQGASYRMTIDNGLNSWSPPIIIYPDPLCNVETA